MRALGYPRLISVSLNKRNIEFDNRHSLNHPSSFISRWKTFASQILNWSPIYYTGWSNCKCFYVLCRKSKPQIIQPFVFFFSIYLFSIPPRYDPETTISDRVEFENERVEFLTGIANLMASKVAGSMQHSPCFLL